MDDISVSSDRGICDLCEKKPVAPDDVFCVECRADTNASSDVLRDPVEKALNVHWRMEPLSDNEQSLCRCGQTFTGGPAYHRRHLAEAIYDALGQLGPEPWDFGEQSPSKERFAPGGYGIISDEGKQRPWQL